MHFIKSCCSYLPLLTKFIWLCLSFQNVFLLSVFSYFPPFSALSFRLHDQPELLPPFLLSPPLLSPPLSTAPSLTHTLSCLTLSLFRLHLQLAGTSAASPAPHLPSTSPAFLGGWEECKRTGHCLYGTRAPGPLQVEEDCSKQGIYEVYLIQVICFCIF